MDQQQLESIAAELDAAMTQRTTVSPLTTRFPELSLTQAYQVSKLFLAKREARGERVVGKKIGLTSKVVQDMLGVHQPDFGFLTNKMMYSSGAEIEFGQLIQAKSEGEIAFILKHDLKGPNVTPEAVMAATESVAACFEIVDSRVENWQIKIQDTVADNASCGVFVIGDKVSPEQVDFENCKMVIRNKGEIVAEGKGSAALGSPLNCVAWLANALGEYGVELKAGDVILSGSLAAMIPCQHDDDMVMEIEGIGQASYRFV